MAACRDSLADIGLLSGLCARVGFWAPSVEPAGLLFLKPLAHRVVPRKAHGFFLMTWLHMINPFTVVAMALGFAMVASLMSAAIEQ